MKKQLPNQDELLKIFKYDPVTGNIYKKNLQGVAGNKVGAILKNMGGKRYYRVRIPGHGRSEFLSHRVIFKMVHGYDPIEVDHIDGNGLNNALVNLRESNPVSNHQNVRKSTRNTSGIVGVSRTRCKTKWRARIRVGKDDILLGVFVNFEDAVRVRLEANIRYKYHKNHGCVRPLQLTHESVRGYYPEQ